MVQLAEGAGVAAGRRAAPARSRPHRLAMPPDPAIIEVTEKVHVMGIEAIRIFDALTARSTTSIVDRVQELRGRMLQARQAVRAHALGEWKDVCAIAGHADLSDSMAELSEEAGRIVARSSRRPTAPSPISLPRTVVPAKALGRRSNEVQLSTADQHNLNALCRAKSTTTITLDEVHIFTVGVAERIGAMQCGARDTSGVDMRPDVRRLHHEHPQGAVRRERRPLPLMRTRGIARTPFLASNRRTRRLHTRNLRPRSCERRVRLAHEDADD